jgi:XTP/dITP diphosphohydrolase
VYNDGNTLRSFLGKTEGKISSKVSGPGWGYDPIFIPSGSELSFGQLKDKKIRLSHRTKAVTAFAKWYSRSQLGVRMPPRGRHNEDSKWQDAVHL